MAYKKSTSSRPKSGGRSRVSRPSPTRVMRAQIAPHIKTLSNGQPRPRRRS